MAQLSPPTSHPSNLQHVKFQTPDKHMTSVPQTSKGPSLRQPSTTPADSFTQTIQHLKIASKQAINKKIFIPEGLNIKERIGNLGLMWPRTYATKNCSKIFYNRFILRTILSSVAQHGLQRKLKQKFSTHHTCRPSL